MGLTLLGGMNQAALSAVFAGKSEIANSDIASLQDPVYSSPATVKAIGSVAGTLYGASLSGSGLHRSTDDGATWTVVKSSFSTGAPVGIALTGDGEAFVVTVGAAYKSTGWAANPLAATWASVATPTPANDGQAAATFIHSTWDVWGQYVLLGEYVNPKHNSRKVMLSSDHGATFTTVWDKFTHYTNPTDQDGIHIHAVAIDGFKSGNPRLWFTHGDLKAGVFYSDDLGSSWTQFTNAGTALATGVTLSTYNMMTVTATPAGMVFTTDSSMPDGVYRVLRTITPGDMVLERMLHFPYPAASGSLLGFGVMAWRDPDTNLVWQTWNVSKPALAGTPAVPGFVTVTDGKRATIAWQTPETSASGTSDSVVTEGIGKNAAGKIVVAYRHGVGSTQKQAVLAVGGRGGRSYAELNAGNALGGYALTRDSVAIGLRTTASGRSVINGVSATAPSTDGTSDIRAVVLGAEAIGGSQGVAIGAAASASQTRATGIGSAVSVTGPDGTSVGANSRAHTDCTVVGAGSTTSTWLRSAIIGKSLTSTASDQVLFGGKHLELTELAADPAAGAVNAGRLYFKDNGSGKTQLCVRFNTGAVQVLSTEP